MAKVPIPPGLPFQAYFFWPASALAHTAFFLLGPGALWGLALGSLALNLTSWLPLPHALAMTALQTMGPWMAWRILVRLGCPSPNLHKVRDLVHWLGVSALSAGIFSAVLGAKVVGHALQDGGFRDPLATGFSWFLGDLTALVCLGPTLLLLFGPGPPAAHAPHPLRAWLEGLALASLSLLCLFAGWINPALPRDADLALQFALVLPALWIALRYGPRLTSLGISILSLVVLVQLWSRGPGLPEGAFRFLQGYLMVLALAALVTSASADEARSTRLAMHARDLQAQRMEAVSTLAGGLVHGFNNQLTVLLGNLERLRLTSPATPDLQGLVDRMEESAQAMEGTVRQLRALSHQSPLHSYAVPLSEALGPFLSDLRSLRPGIRFEQDLAEDPIVALDPGLLRQALHLLFANSLEAIPAQGLIQLRSRRADPWLLLVLEDDGPGMSSDVLRQACDPYFSTKAAGRGRGLGLSIAFSLARQMGGWLSLDSRPGEGTRAELGLPLGQGTVRAATPRIVTANTRRILLADDEAGIREIVHDVLEAEGFEIVDAVDGQEALDLFESDPQGWELAILDQVMPGLHGTEVLAHIDQRRPDLPALLISGYTAGARPGLLEGPHRKFLAKPFRIHQLLAAIEAVGLSLPGKLHGE